MARMSCVYCILLVCFALSCGAVSINLSKVCINSVFVAFYHIYRKLKQTVFFIFKNAWKGIRKRWHSHRIKSQVSVNLSAANKSFEKCFICRIKRSVEDLDSLLNEIITDEELLNLPLHVADKEKPKSQYSPLLQYLLLRKPSLFYNLLILATN